MPNSNHRYSTLTSSLSNISLVSLISGAMRFIALSFVMSVLLLGHSSRSPHRPHSPHSQLSHLFVFNGAHAIPLFSSDPPHASQSTHERYSLDTKQFSSSDSIKSIESSHTLDNDNPFRSNDVPIPLPHLLLDRLTHFKQPYVDPSSDQIGFFLHPSASAISNPPIYEANALQDDPIFGGSEDRRRLQVSSTSQPEQSTSAMTSSTTPVVLGWGEWIEVYYNEPYCGAKVPAATSFNKRGATQYPISSALLTTLHTTDKAIVNLLYGGFNKEGYIEYGNSKWPWGFGIFLWSVFFAIGWIVSCGMAFQCCGCYDSRGCWKQSCLSCRGCMNLCGWPCCWWWGGCGCECCQCCTNGCGRYEPVRGTIWQDVKDRTQMWRVHTICVIYWVLCFGILLWFSAISYAFGAYTHKMPEVALCETGKVVYEVLEGDSFVIDPPTVWDGMYPMQATLVSSSEQSDPFSGTVTTDIRTAQEALYESMLNSTDEVDRIVSNMTQFNETNEDMTVGLTEYMNDAGHSGIVVTLMEVAVSFNEGFYEVTNETRNAVDDVLDEHIFDTEDGTLALMHETTDDAANQLGEGIEEFEKLVVSNLPKVSETYDDYVAKYWQPYAWVALYLWPSIVVVMTILSVVAAWCAWSSWKNVKVTHCTMVCVGCMAFGFLWIAIMSYSIGIYGLFALSFPADVYHWPDTQGGFDDWVYSLKDVPWWRFDVTDSPFEPCLVGDGVAFDNDTLTELKESEELLDGAKSDVYWKAISPIVGSSELQTCDGVEFNRNASQGAIDTELLLFDLEKIGNNLSWLIFIDITSAYARNWTDMMSVYPEAYQWGTQLDEATVDCDDISGVGGIPEWLCPAGVVEGLRFLLDKLNNEPNLINGPYCFFDVDQCNACTDDSMCIDKDSEPLEGGQCAETDTVVCQLMDLAAKKMSIRAYYTEINNDIECPPTDDNCVFLDIDCAATNSCADGLLVQWVVDLNEAGKSGSEEIECSGFNFSLTFNTTFSSATDDLFALPEVANCKMMSYGLQSLGTNTMERHITAALAMYLFCYIMFFVGSVFGLIVFLPIFLIMVDFYHPPPPPLPDQWSVENGDEGKDETFDYEYWVSDVPQNRDREVVVMPMREVSNVSDGPSVHSVNEKHASPVYATRSPTWIREEGTPPEPVQQTAEPPPPSPHVQQTAEPPPPSPYKPRQFNANNDDDLKEWSFASPALF
eukprot:GHVN01053382.1.p1 GENE.GHVN01053382.1~~GHVN01053382.1.p1  ORF type:complete len:1203 (-),score=212.68 GHVN01053382.1:310-3918(-)